MRIFLYEFVTGGGLLGEDAHTPFAAALLPEARAMITALAQDFLTVLHAEPCEIHVLCGPPAPANLFAELEKLAKGAKHTLTIHPVADAAAETALFQQLAGACDWTVVIAPETAGHLLRRAESVVAAGGRLLGPSPAFIALTANKHATATRLAAAGVAVPEGELLEPGAPLPAQRKYPAVVKPLDGCGSQGMQVLSSPTAAIQVPHEAPLRLETFVSGEACSMAVLCGPAYTYPLQLCGQTLSRDGALRYLGGTYAFDENKENRARRLVKAALKALPEALGYVGFDLVLGAAADGRGDVVIEVNPRLTTSYIAQRQVYLTNLAHMLLETAHGRWPHGKFSIRKQLAFDTSGIVTRL